MDCIIISINSSIRMLDDTLLRIVVWYQPFEDLQEVENDNEF